MESKLYSPVFCYMLEYESKAWEGSDDPREITQQEALYYLDEIRAAILKERMPEEKERGLMEYYDEYDSINQKVHSLFVDVEEHGGKLWAVATLEITAPLTPDELITLRNALEGQYSDGFGEGFEQHGIEISEGELNVCLWKYGDEFFIDTQEQFASRLGIELQPDILSNTVTTESIEPYQSTELIQQLHDRIDSNLSDFFRVLREDLALESIPTESKQIAAVFDAHWFLKEYQDWNTADLEYILQFQNPLEMFSDHLLDTISGSVDLFGVMFTDGGILDKQVAHLQGYDLITTVDRPPLQKTVCNENQSVLDKIRQSNKEKKEHPAIQKDNQDCKRKGLEL